MIETNLTLYDVFLNSNYQGSIFAQSQVQACVRIARAYGKNISEGKWTATPATQHIVTIPYRPD
jgi:hypothetical protein